MKIEELVAAYCLDWDLSHMKDNEEPRIIPSVGQLRYLLRRIEELEHALNHPEPKVFCENCGETCPEKYLRCKHKGCKE